MVLSDTTGSSVDSVRPVPDPARNTGGSRRGLMLAMGLLVVLWLATLPFLRFRVFPDAAAYVAIAEHYLAGRFDVAVNAYWSPLVSWLWALPLGAGVEPALATKIGGLVAGLLTLHGVYRLLRPLPVPSWAADVTLVALVPFLVLAGSLPTPDLLMTGLLTVWVARLLDPAFLVDRRFAAVTGVVAGLAALAKLYALPVVLTVTVMVLLIAPRHGIERRRAFPSHAIAALGLAVVIGTWGVVISITEGTPTLGTAASVNLDVASATGGGSPIYRDGLFPPPHPDADSAWEDPGALPGRAAEGSGSGAESPGWSSARAQTVVQNLKLSVRQLLAWAPLLVLAGVAHLWLVVDRGLETSVRRRVETAALAAAIHLGGLQLVYVQQRYAWFTLVAIVPGTLLGLWRFGVWRRARHRDPSRGGPLPGALLAAGVGVLVLTLVGPVLREAPRVAAAADLHRDLASDLDGLGLDGARVASDRAWSDTLLMCFYAGCRSYGQTSPEAHADWRTQLERHEVQLYLRWGDQLPDDVQPLQVQTVVGPIDERTLYVYRAEQLYPG